MNERSPHKEVGMHGRNISSGPHARKPEPRFEWEKVKRNTPASRHRWAPAAVHSSTKAAWRDRHARTRICTKCHKPQFAAGGTVCRGRRKIDKRNKK